MSTSAYLTLEEDSLKALSRNDVNSLAAVRADREGRFFTFCSSYAQILKQR